MLCIAILYASALPHPVESAIHHLYDFMQSHNSITIQCILAAMNCLPIANTPCMPCQMDDKTSNDFKLLANHFMAAIRKTNSLSQITDDLQWFLNHSNEWSNGHVKKRSLDEKKQKIRIVTTKLVFCIIATTLFGIGAGIEFKKSKVATQLANTAQVQVANSNQELLDCQFGELCIDKEDCAGESDCVDPLTGICPASLVPPENGNDVVYNACQNYMTLNHCKVIQLGSIESDKCIKLKNAIATETTTLHSLESHVNHLEGIFTGLIFGGALFGILVIKALAALRFLNRE
eukprot:NODE_147_length_15617_cov_0.576750.p5 type:complete len:290 gc:universal NODE_147_length_15617_cov_0.576750:10632-9763(-)